MLRSPAAGGLGQSQAVAGGGAHVRGGHRFGHALVVLHGELRVAGIAARGEHHGLSAHFHGLAGGRTGAAHAYDRAAFHDELFDLRIGVQSEVARGLGGVHQAGDVVAAALLALALDLDRVPALPQTADSREDLLLVDKAVVFHPAHGVQRVVGEDAHEGRVAAESPPSKVWV